MPKWIYFGMKQRVYNMRKSLLLLSTLLFLFACKTEKKFNENLYGHWVSEDFYNHIKSNKPLQDFTGEKLEFIIQTNDTNYTLVNLNGKVTSGPLELMENNNLVIKNFYGNYQNADIVYSNGKVDFINPNTSESIHFVKIEENEFTKSESISFNTFSIPLINKNYIAGKYLLNSDTVQFNISGKIVNLENHSNYSFCLDESCRNSAKMNTIFLSDKINEGNFYEYTITKDSLIIYEIDQVAVARGYNPGNVGVKYRMKKIN